jgi:hypothetical protein
LSLFVFKNAGKTAIVMQFLYRSNFILLAIIYGNKINFGNKDVEKNAKVLKK